jgi:protein TonB
MFEQSVVTHRSRPWTVAISLTLQCGAVAAAILWSILHIESLGPIALPDPIPPFRQSSAVKVVTVQRADGPVSTKSITAPVKVFAAPARIAPAAVAFADLVEAPPAVSAIGSGIGILDGVASAVADAANTLTRGVVPAIATRISPQPKPTGPKPKPQNIGGDVLEAKIIKRVIPEYPPIARQMRLSGVVQLAGVIDRDGSVKSLKAIDGHPMLVKAALDAVRQWKYRPTLLNGEPVEVIAPITVRFVLN